MKQKSLQESFTDFKNNKITRSVFHNLINTNSFARKLVNSTNTLEDSIKILMNKKVLFESITFNIKSSSATPETTSTDSTIPQSPSSSPSLTPSVAPSPVAELSNINKPEYQFYVYNPGQGKIVGGENNADAARALAKQLAASGPVKLVNAHTLKTKYHIDPNDNLSWGDDGQPDPDGNDELSEEQQNAKIQEDIENLLNEFRAQLSEEPKLPDTYDDDLKAAGLTEEGID